MTTSERNNREVLSHAARVVIKLGTRLLVRSDGRLNHPRLAEFARVLAELHHAGRQVVLVSSGAIGAGVEALGLRERPKDLPDLQMAAAVGQARLMTCYQQLFATHNIRIGQVLLTHDDLNNRTRHLNARNTMMNLLRNRIIPIVNENDVVSVQEIKVGDNDQLAALVTMLVDAEVMLLMTSVSGLLAPNGAGGTQKISWLPDCTPEALSWAGDKGSALSTGGMRTKLAAADSVRAIGALAVIADGRTPENIARVLQGRRVGTLVGDLTKTSGRVPEKRKQWIAFFHRGKGRLMVDEGARRVLETEGRSLLAIGVTDVNGAFTAGEVVDIVDTSGTLFAQGLSEHDAETVRRIKGKNSASVREELGPLAYPVVVHRDNLVLRAKKEPPP